MDKDTTRKLSRILEETKACRETEEFIKAHTDKEDEYFYQYLNRKIGEKNLASRQVVKKSGISKSYVYNILNGDKLNPGRDKVICLCIGANFTYKETQKALELSKHANLYPRDERDVRIAIAINNEIYDVLEVNLILEKNHLEPLKA